MPHGGEIPHIAFRSDGRAYVAAYQDGFARVWDVATGRLATSRPFAHPAPVLHAAFSPDGRRVVTACEDGVARLWDAGTGAETTRSTQYAGPVNFVEFDPSGSRFVTASGGLENVATTGSAQVWDAATGRAVGDAMEHRGRVIGARFDPAGTRVVTASDDHSAAGLERGDRPAGHGPAPPRQGRRLGRVQPRRRAGPDRERGRVRATPG